MSYALACMVRAYVDVTASEQLSKRESHVLLRTIVATGANMASPTMPEPALLAELSGGPRGATWKPSSCTSPS
eukprot:gene26903-4516_t